MAVNRNISSDNRHWRPPILQTVALDGSGVPEVLKAIEAHREYLCTSGLLAKRERMRVQAELLSLLQRQLLDQLVAKAGEEQIDAWIERIAAREVDAYTATRKLCET
jgi:LAO/AO transport system kinase